MWFLSLFIQNPPTTYSLKHTFTTQPDSMYKCSKYHNINIIEFKIPAPLSYNLIDKLKKKRRKIIERMNGENCKKTIYAIFANKFLHVSETLQMFVLAFEFFLSLTLSPTPTLSINFNAPERYFCIDDLQFQKSTKLFCKLCR